MPPSTLPPASNGLLSPSPPRLGNHAEQEFPQADRTHSRGKRIGGDVVRRSEESGGLLRPYLRWILSGVGAVILIRFILQIDLVQLISDLKQLRFPFLLEGLAFTALNIAAKAVRWQAMVCKVAGVRMGFGEGVGAVLAGVAGSSLLPGRVFDAAKPTLLHVRYQIPARLSVPAVLVERLLDMLALVCIFFLSIVFTPNVAAVVPVGVVLTGCTLLLIFGLLLSRGSGRLFPAVRSRLTGRRAAAIVQTVEGSLDVMRRSAYGGMVPLLSVVAMVAEVGRVHAIFSSFGLDLPVHAIALTFTGSVLIGLLALIPGGVGVVETSQVGLVTRLMPQVATEAVQSAVLLDRVVSYYLLVTVGALLLLGAGRLKEKERGYTSGVDAR